LLGLGNYFATQKSLHQYYLKDIYDIAYQYADSNFKDDSVVKQLVAIDYYLQNKVRPQILYINDLSKPEKNIWIKQLGLNEHKFRYIMLPIDFDFHLFISNNIIVNGEYLLIIQYDGVNKPIVINNQNKLQYAN
jgi:hypothetical protein